MKKTLFCTLLGAILVCALASPLFAAGVTAAQTDGVCAVVPTEDGGRQTVCSYSSPAFSPAAVTIREYGADRRFEGTILVSDAYETGSAPDSYHVLYRGGITS